MHPSHAFSSWCIRLPRRFSDLHGFEKPNDLRALALMDDAAKEVLREFPDVRIAFGQSDEYSFVLQKDTSIYGEAQHGLMDITRPHF